MTPFTSPEIDYSLLEGHSAIITGGASGLGLAVAQKFAGHGAWVTIADLQDEQGHKMAEDLSKQGYRASETLDIAALFAGMDGERKGLVDLMLQTAGEPSLNSDPPRPPHKAIDVNLIGVYLSTFLALHYFRLSSDSASAPEKQQLRTKSLILVSSMTGYIDLPYNTGYSVSKYGIRGLFRSIRSQTGRVNVRTNNIAPAYILTPLTMRVHGITSPDQPSEATGTVLPWAPIQYLVDSVCHCATNEAIYGRSFAIQPSGFIDMDEDVDKGYGGRNMWRCWSKTDS